MFARAIRHIIICFLIVFFVATSVGELYGQSRVDNTEVSTSKRDKKFSKRKLRKQQEQRIIDEGSKPDLTKYEVVNGVLKEVVVVEKDSIDQLAIVADSLLKDAVNVDTLELALDKKNQRELARRLSDSTHVRHNRIFRDTLPVSRVAALSVVLPGFSQLYNSQAWKMPILYGVTGGAIAGFSKMNKEYRSYKLEYESLKNSGASRSQLNDIQTNMIRYNTSRQLFMIGAFASYIYFIGDGVLNYKGDVTPIKKATTLSTIMPGAGQIYNKSYWKLPIVVGGFATMAYVVDFNTRAYTRFKTAYELIIDGDDSTVDEFGGQISASRLQQYVQSARRNRDLSLIITGAFYLLNIVDAHVDAHLKDFDVDDNLARFELQPRINQIYSTKSGFTNTVGMQLSFRF